MTNDNTNQESAFATVVNDGYGAVKTQAIRLAALLKLADLVKDEPKSVAELAQASGTHQSTLYTLLYTLASCGYFVEVEPGVFGQSPLSYVLRTDIPRSLNALIILQGEWWQWQALQRSLQTIQTGKEVFSGIFGKDYWTYLREDDPEGGQRFAQAMRSVYQQTQSRLALVAGNFFEAIPPGGDIYIIKHIIHDWEDPECIQLLANCCKVMNVGSRLLVVDEIIVPGKKIASGVALLDLMLHFILPGRKRSEEEHRALFEAAGLQLTHIYPTESDYIILETVKK